MIVFPPFLSTYVSRYFTYTLSGSSYGTSSQEEYWDGLPFPSPRNLPDLETEPMSPALAGRFFITEPPGSPNAITLRDGMRREEGGGFRMGDTCTPMADSCQCVAKTTTIL